MVSERNGKKCANNARSHFGLKPNQAVKVVSVFLNINSLIANYKRTWFTVANVFWIYNTMEGRRTSMRTLYSYSYRPRAVLTGYTAVLYSTGG